MTAAVVTAAEPKFLTYTQQSALEEEEEQERGGQITIRSERASSRSIRPLPPSMTPETPAMYAKGKGSTAPSDNQAREK